MSACAATRYDAARIVSNPPGAQVINEDDGSVIGITPLTHSWKDNSGTRQYIAVKLIKEGYYAERGHFWLDMRHTNINDATQSPNLVEITLQKKGG